MSLGCLHLYVLVPSRVLNKTLLELTIQRNKTCTVSRTKDTAWLPSPTLIGRKCPGVSSATPPLASRAHTFHQDDKAPHMLQSRVPQAAPPPGRILPNRLATIKQPSQ